MLARLCGNSSADDSGSGALADTREERALSGRDGCLLSQSPVPELLQRKIPLLTTATKRKLTLSNPVRQLDAAECDGCISSRLKTRVLSK
jgi:hypothetical protein